MNLAPTISLLSTCASQNISTSDDIALQGFVLGVLTTVFAIALCKLVFILIDYFND